MRILTLKTSGAEGVRLGRPVGRSRYAAPLPPCVPRCNAHGHVVNSVGLIVQHNPSKEHSQDAIEPCYGGVREALRQPSQTPPTPGPAAQDGGRLRPSDSHHGRTFQLADRHSECGSADHLLPPTYQCALPGRQHRANFSEMFSVSATTTAIRPRPTAGSDRGFARSILFR